MKCHCFREGMGNKVSSLDSALSECSGVSGSGVIDFCSFPENALIKPFKSWTEAIWDFPFPPPRHKDVLFVHV